MNRINYPVCAECGHTLNPALEDDCDRYYILPTGESVCAYCFQDWVRNLIEDDPGTVAAALGVPICFVNH